MGGRRSRNKGARGERLLAKELLALGWDAKRVPLSGAMSGYKGDVVAKRGDQYLNFELKFHAGVFTKIYDLYYAHLKRAQDDLLCFVAPTEPGDKQEAPTVCVSVSTSLDAVLEKGGLFAFHDRLPEYADYKRTFAKIIKMRRLLGEADVLVLKDNRKAFLYLRFS